MDLKLRKNTWAYGRTLKLDFFLSRVGIDGELLSKTIDLGKLYL